MNSFRVMPLTAVDLLLQASSIYWKQAFAQRTLCTNGGGSTVAATTQAFGHCSVPGGFWDGICLARY
eukprot:m.1154641 g.1154641  ORF g.1154641 m.1154641 type:complete len:67 (+) comp24488_c0_seq46:189-389(+)